MGVVAEPKAFRESDGAVKGMDQKVSLLWLECCCICCSFFYVGLGGRCVLVMQMVD